MRIVLILLNLVLVFLSCDIKQGWKGVKPLETKKSEVEKIFGKPVVEKDGFFGYRTPEAYINIEYTALPCSKSVGGRGSYNVPESTVFNYIVTLTKRRRLSDVDYDPWQYEKSGDDGHLKDYAAYSNEADGVTIEVSIEDGVEYAGVIHFYPTPANEKKFECQ